jgi:hypothetical protein
VHAALINEDNSVWVDASYPLARASSLLLVALRSEECLFLSGRPSRSKARLMLAVETEML